MNDSIRIASILSFPSLSEYARSVSVYLLNFVLEYDGELISAIESSDDIPTDSILKAVERAYEKHQLSLFDYDEVCKMAKVEPSDFYASKLISNDFDYSIVNQWFKRAVIQSTYQPLAFIQLRVLEK
ncbi:hypothetical protein OCT63_18315 [Vibrio sp. RW]|uniref:hypothetical protein n=1 Tax=Vibrio sp. RW TaxID=2998833 RepID=UPI0022CD7949|nr:hypothetical protein [Vibrio sp. RW]MDA0146184.1 hypothetical protein [Vibrio sp. RW]